MPATELDQIVNLCKRRGFVYPSAEIYGGFRSAYDYGPLGALMLRNVKDAWVRAMVQERDDVVLIDAAILGPPQVWEASGHLANFTDPLVDCTNCKNRFRLDKLDDPNTCPSCGKHGTFTEARQFNLMFKTHAGPVEDSATVAYLRPETAQGMFVNFANVAADDAQEAAVRHRPGRQVASATRSRRRTGSSAPASSSRWRWSSSCRRPTARSGTSTGAPSASTGTSRHGIPAEHAAPAAARRRRAVALLLGHVRRRVPVPVGLRRARGHRPAHRLRPQGRTPSARARSSTTSTRPRTSATCRT